jgi:hypothetical protein
MNGRNFALAVLVSLALVTLAKSQTPATKFADCPVTIPPATPDSLHSGLGTRNAYWNGNLSVGAFWPDATVRIGPGMAGYTLNGPLEMKYPWLRAGGLTGKLTITGRRLDAASPPLQADIPSGYGNTGFQATGLIFPTEGCWEITGNVDDTTLTFVNRVIRTE